ncbi:MAG: hypothetical protein ACM3SP_00570 [Chloroflexota bacterium]
MIASIHGHSSHRNSNTPYNMLHESYARSLRVIGQALEALRINAFTLEKNGDKYIVREWEPSFLKNIADEVWGAGNFGQTNFTNTQRSDLLVYDSSDAERLETTGRARRGAKKIQSADEISSGLRVVGDFLDKKRAMTFNIWWSTESVTVRYKTAEGDPKETTFTVQNLQDQGVGMYLRRSSRQHAK